MILHQRLKFVKTVLASFIIRLSSLLAQFLSNLLSLIQNLPSTLQNLLGVLQHLLLFFSLLQRFPGPKKVNQCGYLHSDVLFWRLLFASIFFQPLEKSRRHSIAHLHILTPHDAQLLGTSRRDLNSNQLVLLQKKSRFSHLLHFQLKATIFFRKTDDICYSLHYATTIHQSHHR